MKNKYPLGKPAKILESFFQFLLGHLNLKKIRTYELTDASERQIGYWKDKGTIQPTKGNFFPHYQGSEIFLIFLIKLGEDWSVPQKLDKKSLSLAQ